MSFRRNAFFLIIVLLLSAGAFARADESLDGLVARAANAPSGERSGLDIEIAERELQEADHLYTNGKADAARMAVENIVSYSEKACEAIQSKGKLKNTEISLRKMAAKLRDIKRSLAFEDQPPVAAAADKLEKLRTGLLTRMFGKEQH